MKRKQRFFVGVLGLSLLSFQPAAAREGKRKGHFKEVMKELNLTEKQLVEVKEFRRSHSKDRKATRKKIKSLREQIKEGFIRGDEDGKLESYHSQMKKLTDQMADKKFKKMIFMKNILSEEQRIKFIEIRKNRGHKKRR